MREVAWLIELRCVQIFRACDNRAAILERLMGIKSGIRQTFADPTWREKILGVIPIGHAVAIALFYRIVWLVWLLLVGYSAYKIILLK